MSLSRLDSGRQLAKAEVLREPVAAALSPDGTTLAIANLLPKGPANEMLVRAGVSLLDSRTLKVRSQVPLPNGSTALRGIAFHPARNLCAVVHNIGRFQVPTTQVEHGWMNVSALTLISLEPARVMATFLLDETRRGAANPSSVGWSPDGLRLCVTHAGTHELSLIDFPALEQRLAKRAAGTVVSDLAFLQDIRTRVQLPGNGPRALVIKKGVAYVAEFFSDTITVVDLASRAVAYKVELGHQTCDDPRREGERLFHDATLCHQSWQSCATCHPDGRVDGFNWDLQNDGLGNPKNTRSLLLAHLTPPAMSLGTRPSAEAAVRSGLRHILFAVPVETQASAIDEYLRSLQPVPSPYLVQGKLSRAALRGKRLFEDPKVGCATCHPGPLFTDKQKHTVDTSRKPGSGLIAFDTPTLVECWRTAPYLHDGSALTIKDVLTKKNSKDCHGRTSGLSAHEIADLCAYVLSL